VPASAAEVIEAALQQHCGAVSRRLTEAGEVEVTGYVAGRPSAGVLATDLALAAAAAAIATPVASIEPLRPADWLAVSRASFAPVRVGRFFIHQPDDKVRPPTGSIALAIDAGLAFGTGRHASTAGCLLALEDPALARLRGRALDIGTGSGVLAIAFARRWYRPVVAADIDPRAVVIARAAAVRNGVGQHVRVCVADGLAQSQVAAAAPFTLVFANILARPLKRLARSIAAATAPDGRLVLAGFIATDANDVEHAYAAFGFRRLRRIDREGWMTLVLLRRGKSPPVGPASQAWPVRKPHAFSAASRSR
jgi:ribosomal protein L11 methyltransferase